MRYRIIQIAEYFGIKHQSLKAREELEELTQALKNLGDKFTVERYENLVEEIADVEIMLEQMKYLHEVPEKEIEKVKWEKIGRTIRRNEIDG